MRGNWIMMNCRFFGWLAAATVAFTFSGALSASAQTPDRDEHKSVNAQELQQSSGEHNLLAMASVPVATTSEPAAAPPSGGSGFNWTGFYVGGHFGRDSGHANMKVDPLPSAAQFVNLSTQSLHTNPAGKIGGLQGGYNLQRGPVVYGIESDYSFSDMKGTKVISPIVQNNGTPFPGTSVIGTANSTVSHQDTDWIGTLRLRLGATPVPRLLVYGTGGLAYGHVTYFATTDFTPVGTERYPAFADKTRGGWCAGAGTELGIQSHFTARFEYLFYDLGSEILTAKPIPPLPPFGIRYTWATQGQIVRAAFNFKF